MMTRFFLFPWLNSEMGRQTVLPWNKERPMEKGGAEKERWQAWPGFGSANELKRISSGQSVGRWPQGPQTQIGDQARLGNRWSSHPKLSEEYRQLGRTVPPSKQSRRNPKASKKTNRIEKALKKQQETKAKRWQINPFKIIGSLTT